MCSSGYIALRRQATRTPERSSSLHKSRRGVYHCTRSTRYLHSNPFKIHSYIPNHGFCYKRICVRPALLPFATGLTHSGAEFITAPEPERSSLHKRYPIDHLKCIPNTFLRPSKKDICVRPALSPFAAGHLHSGAEFITAQEPVWSSPLHQIVLDRFAQMHSKYIPTSLTMVFVKQKNCVPPAISPFTAGSPHSGAESPLHIKYHVRRNYRPEGKRKWQSRGRENMCVYVAKTIKYTSGSWAAKRVGMNKCSYFTTQSSSQVPIVACVLTYEGC